MANYKTGEKEDASFMVYFVVEALSNSACINWYKQILPHKGTWTADEIQAERL